MTLPSAPNSISFSQINTELSRVSTNTLCLNDSTARGLAGVPTLNSQISMSNFYGKSNAPTFLGQCYAGGYYSMDNGTSYMVAAGLGGNLSGNYDCGINWTAALVLNGYDDWFNPSLAQYGTIWNNRCAFLTGVTNEGALAYRWPASGCRWTSTLWNVNVGYMKIFQTGGVTCLNRGTSTGIRASRNQPK